MATSAEDKKVVNIASARRTLFGEVADNKGFDRYFELMDVNRLVLDSNASRSDLRIIEESDDEVQQCIETRMDTLVGVDWRLEGGSVEVKDWLTLQVKRHYEHIVRNAWNGKLYGYSVMERIWEKVDGYYIVKRLPEKPFEWFIPMRDDTLIYRRNSNLILPSVAGLQGEVVDQTFKFLLTRNAPTWRNPRGKALLAYLFWPWFYRKATWQFWMQFLERSGQPIMVGKGADPAQIATQLAMAVQDAIIGVPTGTDVEVISPANKGDAFNLAEDRLVRRIQKILLGQTLTSDTATKGSGAKSLGEVHNEVRLDKTIGDLKLVGPTVQNYIDALRLLNFPSSKPVYLVYAIDRGLEAGRANRDSTLVNTGNIEFTKEYFIREYGFNEGDFTIVSPSKVKQSQADQKKTNANNADNSGSNTGNDGQSNNQKNAKAERDEMHIQTLEVIQAVGGMVTETIREMPTPEITITMSPIEVNAGETTHNIAMPVTLPTIKQTVVKHIVSKQTGDGQLEATVTEEVTNNA